jgi:hypothetical protein
LTHSQKIEHTFHIEETQRWPVLAALWRKTSDADSIPCR